MFGDETLKVWDLDTGRALRTLEGYSAEVSCVAVTADGKRAGGFRVWGQNAEGMGPGQRPAYTTSTASRRLPAHWDESKYRCRRFAPVRDKQLFARTC